MAHEHSILDIYNAKTGSADGTVNIHNVPNKPWLGRAYADGTVQRGATRSSGLHANVAGTDPGFSLDGAGGAYFDATQAEYDTTPTNGEMVVKVNSTNFPMGGRLDDRAGIDGILTFGGDPTADPYIDRDYISDAPGLGG